LCPSGSTYGPTLITTTTFQAGAPTFAAPNNAAIAYNYYNKDQKSIAISTFDGKSVIGSPTVLYNAANVTASGTGAGMWPAFLPPPPGTNRTFGDVVFQREIVYNTRDFGGTRSQADASYPDLRQNAGSTDEIWWVNSTGATYTPVRLNALNGCNPDTGSSTPQYPCPTSSSYLPTGFNMHGTATNSSGTAISLPSGVSASSFVDTAYNYEPTALPITVGGYSWVVFTSRRMYGNIATINPYWSDPRYQDLSQEPTPKKLWIAAIDANPTVGGDPSHPAFYLPGQELMAGNARAYYVLNGCNQAATSQSSASSANVCASNLDCCQAPTGAAYSVQCVLDTPLTSAQTRHCLQISNSCAGSGQTCSQDTDCCSYASGGKCANAQCQDPSNVTFNGASFNRTFSASCPSGSIAVWRFFEWIANTPSNSTITFTAQTAGANGVYGAPVTIGVAWYENGLLWDTSGMGIGTCATPSNADAAASCNSFQTIDNLLQAAHQTSQPNLMITATLAPDSTHTMTPTLVDWQQQFDCVPNQ
jgi:hypothetical protein